ncbi:two component transcriptional regulator, LytTR family [Pilibacter termitis]|jgi:DNA-binding LytR/AlgR family response regulator|uniref:Two component transcriptional regulator, LytTR family n=1 Tax=Pilibacter termitis TaxID=263852 RepID=A0A1T4MI02_9ENTE|nr:LytTR family DNA-binding domain-containing protein [Pilibacter termitis]SJZ66404.1 two component transcriptional regulator, LytTR family [Pilibacter termitis]
MKIKIAVCDDSIEITNQIEQLLSEFHSSLFDIDVFQSPERLLELIKETHYDFFILDIEMPEYTGIEIAKYIRQDTLYTPILFLTSFKEYMEDIFKLQAFDYILKPLTKERFFPVLEKVLLYLQYEEDFFTTTFKKKTYSIPYKEIIYFEKQKRNVLIYTLKHQYETVLSTNDLLDKLNDTFIQVHTSFIVNSRYIRELQNNSLFLSCGTKEIEIPISRKYGKQAKKQILIKLKGVM